MSENTYTAVITARGGSKGLPRKNVLELAGKPMIAHTILAALKSERFKYVVVTTDCPEIKEVSLYWGADVIDRPEYLATDKASSLDVIEHALLELGRKGETTSHFVLLQPTSPLRNERHIKEAIDDFENKKGASLVSVLEADHPIQKYLFENSGCLEPVFDWACLTKPRQELKKTFIINGAIYVSCVNDYLVDLNLFVKPVVKYDMCLDDSIDVDKMEDFVRAQALFYT